MLMSSIFCFIKFVTACMPSVMGTLSYKHVTARDKKMAPTGSKVGNYVRKRDKYSSMSLIWAGISLRIRDIIQCISYKTLFRGFPHADTMEESGAPCL